MRNFLELFSIKDMNKKHLSPQPVGWCVSCVNKENFDSRTLFISKQKYKGLSLGKAKK